jgi:hypothetical protein
MSNRYIQVDAGGISAIMPCKQLQVVDGIVTHNNQPVKCHWCKWSPMPEDITGVDGLLLGGFTPVTGLSKLAQRKRYRLAVHSCNNKRPNPLQVLTIGELKAEAKAPKAVAEAQPVEVG